MLLESNMGEDPRYVPKLGCGLTEEVVKNSKGEFWAINGGRKYIESEVEKVGNFYWLKTDEEETESMARQRHEDETKVK